VQNRFYGDRKDVIKWSLALNAALPTSQIVHVAMMRPDDGGAPGRDFGNPGPVARNDAVRYFAQEREAFGANPGLRTADRIVNLDHRIRFVSGMYAYAPQMAYFAEIAHHWLPAAENGHSVVLVDPDNGVRQNGAANNRNGRVSPAELALVWEAMNLGDVLIVYQTPWRWDPAQQVPLADEHRFNPPRTLLANGLEIQADAIQVHEHGDVGFLLAYKT
jgi:hypothetical protein